MLRVGSNNYLQLSYTNGSSWVDISTNPVYTQFRVHENKLEQSVDLGATWIVVSDELAYQFRNSGNKLQVSKDLGVTWEDTSDYIAAWFRFTGNTESSQVDNVGKIQISRDNGITWSDLSGEFTNSLHIKGYAATIATLPSGAVQGDIYGVGPTYDSNDTEQTNPIYQLYVKDSTGWVNNGKFTSISAGVVQTTGTSTTEVMSQKAITDLNDSTKGLIGDKAEKFTSIATEVKTGMAIVSQSGKTFIPSEGGDRSTYCLDILVKGLDYVYYTGRAYENSGGAFLKEDGSFHSTAIEMKSQPLYNHPIAVPEGAYYLNASSRQSDVTVDVKAVVSDKVFLELEVINEKIVEPIKTAKFINDAELFRLYFKGDSLAPRLNFDKNRSIANEGDYVEVVCSTTTPAESAFSVSMFGGDRTAGVSRTAGGIYNGQFYFRSGSVSGSDYRKWDLPAKLDLTKENSFKILNGGTVWELFINGESQGTRPISPLANVGMLFMSTFPEMNYTYKEVTFKTSDGLEKFSGIDLLSQDRTGGEVKLVQDVTKGDLIKLEDKVDGNTSSIKSIMGKGYYSSFNSEYPEVKSSLTFQPYKMNTVGDYMEIEARYFGTRNEYIESLYLFTLNNSNGAGWHSDGTIYFRPYSDATYLIWRGIEANRREWNKIKFLITENGIELFINGISEGVRGVSSDYANMTVTGVATFEVPYDGDFYGQKYDIGAINIKSSETGELNISQPALYKTAQNVELVQRESESSGEAENNPKCFVSYAKDKNFRIYVRDEELQNQYYMFNMELFSTRGLINDEIAYAHFWKIAPTSARCVYSKISNSMTTTSDTLITGGENECVYMSINDDGEAVDFTGGVHGDESIDITEGDFVRFYVDGVPLTEAQLSESFELMPCSTAYLLQRSSMHKTAYRLTDYETNLDATGAGVLSIVGTRFFIDGADSGVDAFATNTVYDSVVAANNDGVTISKSPNNKWQFSKVIIVYPDHPVMATHLKKTTFKDQSYESENTLIFKDTQKVSLWYHGICCLSKRCATFGHNENYVEATFTGEGGNFLSEVGLRLLETYNPTTKMSAKVESWLLDGGGIIEDSECSMFIWDRAADSKYYRKTPTFIPEVGTKMKSVMKVSYNYKKSE